jgi:PAS domain S-box-containing protein
MKDDLSFEINSRRIKDLESRLEEAEQLIEAIKAGEVDAFAINRNNQSQVFTLQTGDFAYRMLVENFGEGALNLSEEGTIVYTNNYFLQLLGIRYEDAIGKSIFNFIHDRSKDHFNEFFKKGLAGQSKGEINLISGNTIIPVYVSLTSLYPTLPTVGLIISDLTLKKQHEEQLLEQNRILALMNKELQIAGDTYRQSEERYHSMIAEVQDYAILLLSKEGVIENWNKGAERIKGYKAEEIVGRNFSVFYTPEDLQDHLPEKLLNKARLTGRSTDENYRVRKDGTRFWASIVITALHDRNNNITGYVKVTRDLTERKIAEEEIKAKAEQLKANNIELQKMNKELESFAYISSHDLQEPLRKIQTFVTRIIEKEEKNLTVTGIDMFRRMQLAARRMQTLIDDLLAYSRTNTAERKFESISFSKIMEEVMEDIAEEIREKNAVIEVTGNCNISIIPFQFRQMMLNLIGNSLKFSHVNINPHIKIKCNLETGRIPENGELIPSVTYCHISVSDNGIGFEPQFHEKIFQVFQRLHSRENYSGTGIGLSIVKKIVENHNGEITAYSEGNGARFDIYIPADALTVQTT